MLPQRQVSKLWKQEQWSYKITKQKDESLGSFHWCDEYIVVQCISPANWNTKSPFSSNSDFLVTIWRIISTYHFSWRSTGTWTFYHPRCHDLCSSEFQTSKLPLGSLFPLQTAFLDAISHLYKRAGPSIRRSVRLSVRHTRVEIAQKRRLWPNCDRQGSKTGM